MDLTEKKPKPKRRVLHEEEYNRDGHWYRSFTVRQEVWPIIEHWAGENGYHLVALKGKKRTYQKGHAPAWYTTILDLKQNENEFTITAWVKVGFTARIFSLFLHPRELPILATGWKGSVVRRKAVHELNILLERLRQAAIADSLGFHIADLDPTTRLLSVLILGTISFFALGIASQLDPSPYITNELFKNSAKPTSIVLGISLLMLTLHNFVITKRFKRPMWKGISTGTIFVGLAVLTASQFSCIVGKMTRTHYVRSCLRNPSEKRCEDIKAALSPKDKQWLVDKMEELQKELSVRPK